MKLNTKYMKIFGIDDVLVGAAISGVGSLGTNLFNSSNVEKTNEANAQQAQLNREFQERMSNTAYQRGMSDMKAAGLNPILAYQKGGASSPSGAQAAMQPFEIKGNPAGDAVNTGMSVLRNRLENANLYQTNKNLQSSEAKQDAEAAQTRAQTEIIKEDLSPAQLRSLQARIDKGVYESPLGSTARKVGTFSQEAARTYEPLATSASKFVPKIGHNAPPHDKQSSTQKTTSDGKGNIKWEQSDRFDSYKGH